MELSKHVLKKAVLYAYSTPTAGRETGELQSQLNMKSQTLDPSLHVVLLSVKQDGFY